MSDPVVALRAVLATLQSIVDLQSLEAIGEVTVAERSRLAQEIEKNHRTVVSWLNSGSQQHGP